MQRSLLSVHDGGDAADQSSESSDKLSVLLSMREKGQAGD